MANDLAMLSEKQLKVVNVLLLQDGKSPCLPLTCSPGVVSRVFLLPGSAPSRPMPWIIAGCLLSSQGRFLKPKMLGAWLFLKPKVLGLKFTSFHVLFIIPRGLKVLPAV